MTGRVVLDILGMPIGISATGQSTESLRRQLGQLITSDRTADRWVEVQGQEIEDALAAATAIRVANSTDLLLHAGAIAHTSGVVVFPGPSGSGKSTVTAACVQQGMGYVTDEIVAVDLSSLAVTGLPRPVMLTPWSMRQLDIARPTQQEDGGPLHETKVAVLIDELHGYTVRRPRSLTHVITLTRAAIPQVRPLSPGQVLETMLRSAFNHYQHGEAAWRACASLAQTCSGWQLAANSPREAARVVGELVTKHHRLATAAK